MNKLKLISVKFLIALLVFSFVGLNASDRKDGKLQKPKSGQNYGDAYRLWVNNINLPLNDVGKIADVNIPPQGALGRYDGKGVIYSSGFMMSGVTNGVMWANAEASSSRIEDYVPGSIDPNDSTQTISPGIFVVKSSDEPFGESWQEWADAVKGGAYFYDGDGDGVYNPVDLNGNGKWDPNEDMPDLLGDETVWCVYNDGLPSGDRSFTDVEPQGIDIRQTVWAYSTSGDLGNIIFVRYSIVNRGTVANEIDSVYFGVWADPDLGDYLDDLVGSDRDLNAGYVYNDGADKQFGANPPTFLIDFFQGPWEFTGDPNDEAYNVRGPIMGIDTIKGAKNLPLTAFVEYMNGVVGQQDPNTKEEARNYLMGLNQAGDVVDPCNWLFGAVLGGVDCTTIDGHYMYSGDPVTLTGWINTSPVDQRQMSNTGPFKLIKDQPVDIVVAYVIGRSKTSALASVKKAKQIDRAAQFVYQNNFNYPAPPPVVKPVIKTTDNKIELIWNTADQLNYNSLGNGYDMRFEGFEVNMYQAPNTAEQEGGTTNKITIAKYDVANNINTVIYEDGVSLERTVIYQGGTQLDSATYSNPNTGWIKLTIDTDPFTNGPLIKGKPYFISITGFALNYDEIVRLDALGNYLIPGTAAVGMVSNVPTLLKDESSIVGIVPGAKSYDPYRENVNTVHAQGGSDSKVTYSVYDKDLTTTDEYEVGFYLDSLSTVYSLYYYVKDKTTDNVIADSSKNYDNAAGITQLHDGVTLNVEWLAPGVKTPSFISGGNWAKPMNRPDTTGAWYVGSDVDSASGVPLITTNTSKVIHVSDMRRIELRFGTQGKAYRYTSGVAHGRPTAKLFYGGNMDGRGYVDVPFTAWVKDDKFGETKQLAVAFIEDGFDSTGRSDAKWNPGPDIKLTHEYIIIFNDDYTADTNNLNLVYTGVPSATSPSKWARLGGYNIPTNDPDYPVTDSMKNVAKSPYFNALAVVGIETTSNDTNYVPTDGVLEIPINYVLTPKDVYTYKVSTKITDAEAKSMFDKVNVYPNPLYAYNPIGSYVQGDKYKPDEPFITFSNLPNEATVKIFSLSGTKLRTLQKNDTNPFLNWDLKNEDGLRVASGMYIAIVSNPKYGEKVLKFAIIMPQKQIQRY